MKYICTHLLLAKKVRTVKKLPNLPSNKKHNSKLLVLKFPLLSTGGETRSSRNAQFVCATKKKKKKKKPSVFRNQVRKFFHFRISRSTRKQVPKRFSHSKFIHLNESNEMYEMNIGIVILIFSSHMVFGDPEEILRMIKHLRKEIKFLNSHQALTEEDKEGIKATEYYLIKLKNMTMEDFELSYDYEGLDNYETELSKHKEIIENFIVKIRNLEEKMISDECVKLIRAKKDEEAAQSFLLINDAKNLRWILNETYEENVFLINNVVDEIPSISLSFKILQILNDFIDKKETKLKLSLLESIKRNVFDKISTSENEKSESLTLMDEIRAEITTPLVEKSTNYLKNGNNTQEIQEIIQTICKEQDYKFMRKIWTQVFSNQTTMNYSQIKKFDKEGQVLILDSFFSEVIKKGIRAETVRDLILIQNDVEKIKNETVNLKRFYVIYDIKHELVKRFEHAFLEKYYNEPEMDFLSRTIFNTDRDVFLFVVEKAVKLVYGKMETGFLIRTISRSSSLGQNILGYKAVFNVMLELGDLDFDRNYHTVMIFDSFIRETILRSKKAKIDKNLQNILNDLPSGLVTQTKVHGVTLKYFKDGFKIDENNIELIVKAVFKAVFKPQHFEEFYLEDEKYEGVDFVRKMEINMLDNGVFLFGQASIYVLEIAEKYKRFLSSNGYLECDSIFKNTLEKRINTLPKSVKNVVFEDENFIKNSLRGGFLHEEGNEVYISKERSKWTFEYSGSPGVYRIKKGLEYLISDFERKVFLTNDSKNEATKWRLIPNKKEIFIKNVVFDEYFYAGDKIDTKKRRAAIFKYGAQPIGASWVISGFLKQ